MEFLLFVTLLVVLDFAAIRFGHDSRDGFADRPTVGRPIRQRRSGLL
jgi:hypothetical protein